MPPNISIIRPQTEVSSLPARCPPQLLVAPPIKCYHILTTGAILDLSGLLLPLEPPLSLLATPSPPTNAASETWGAMP
jgi:hypothetical protein